MVVPPAHQSSNLIFDICVSHKGEIFFQWEATFPSIARRLWWLLQFEDPIRRLSLKEVLIGVGCACVHRGECMRAYMSACVRTVFLKKNTPSVQKKRCASKTFGCHHVRAATETRRVETRTLEFVSSGQKTHELRTQRTTLASLIDDSVWTADRRHSRSIPY
jgi:hypothetical protein